MKKYKVNVNGTAYELFYFTFSASVLSGAAMMVS